MDAWVFSYFLRSLRLHICFMTTKAAAPMTMPDIKFSFVINNIAASELTAPDPFDMGSALAQTSRCDNKIQLIRITYS